MEICMCKVAIDKNSRKQGLIAKFFYNESVKGELVYSNGNVFQLIILGKKNLFGFNINCCDGIFIEFVFKFYMYMKFKGTKPFYITNENAICYKP